MNKQQNSKFMSWDGSNDPQTKALKHGVECLSDSELLGLVLRTGTHEISAVGVASRLLSHRGRQLFNLCDLSVSEMMGFEGIGKAKALQLKAIAELSKRIAQSGLRKDIDFSDANSIAEYYMPQLRFEHQEVLVVALFDTHGRFLEDRTVSKGTLNFAVFSSRDVFSYAIRSMASFVIILHNHPSGDPKPSENDIAATGDIYKCGQMLGIPLLDHIIIGDNVYYSFHQSGYFDSIDQQEEE